VSSDTAEKIAFLERFKADIQAYFAGPEDQATRSRINRGMSRARELVDDAGAMKTVTLSPPAAIGGLMVRGADPFNFILQDYYGMSMVPTVADMIDQAIGVLESPDYDKRKTLEKTTRKEAAAARSAASRPTAGDRALIREAINGGPELPAKVTLSWLIRHVPVSFWFWLIGLIAAAFAAGLRLGQILK